MSRTSTTTIELELYAASAFVPIPQASNSSIKNDGGRPLGDALVNPPPDAFSVEEPRSPSKSTTVMVMVTVVCVTMISSLLSGLVTVGLPTMAADLDIPPSLLLWPISMYALACGCTLLLLGSVADVVGSRPMYLTGCVLQSAFTLACGLSRTSTQLILFRALAGVAISFCLPSAVSIITSTFPEGKSRNLAFAAMGGGQPIGFSVGLTLGGVLSNTIGWRWGFYIAAMVNSVVFVVGVFGLPKVEKERSTNILGRLKHDIDWVGIVLLSASTAMLSYSFVLISDDASSIRRPATLATLILSIALVPAFIVWVGRQEKLGRPAVIPNSLWRNRNFTMICIAVFMIWGVFNAVETYLTLFFQEVQEISPIQTSIRFLPAPIMGAIANIIIGLIAHKVRADWSVIIGISFASVGTLLMCIIQPEWTYWACAFPALMLNPIAADVLFTISNLVITSIFPARTQALAGGVFNTVAQIGKSVGLATSGVIATTITERSRYVQKDSPAALMEGYRAALWYNFAASVATALLLCWGLRGIGKVGTKRD